MRTITFIAYILLSAAVVCCSSLKPYQTEPVRAGVESNVNKSLQELPGPNQKVVAAFYRFRDQTGQYQPSERSISYSTAVTQGATSILIKAMENSGWFTPIEREGISNLLNERRIVQATRKQNNDNSQLPPLLFAGIVLEGGIIGFDSNVITGGAGVRYLGMDVSGQFRKDQVTIYLRAVATKNGKVLKTVHTTKSILSQKIDAGVFRFVATDELLESEVGVTFNEPSVMAVTEAIDEAVKQLIMAGVDDGLWSPANPQAFGDYKTKYQLAAAEQADRQERDYYGITHSQTLRTGFLLSANYSFGSHIGSFGNETQNSGFLLQLEQALNPTFSLKFNAQRSQIGAQRVFSEPTSNLDLLLNGYLTPDFKLSPYVGAGVGILAYDETPEFTNKSTFATFVAEGGLDYRFSKWAGFKVGFNYRYLINDGIDGITVGNIHDQQWNILTGISIYP
jgi:curli production assembly/transport component CsgG